MLIEVAMPLEGIDIQPLCLLLRVGGILLAKQDVSERGGRTMHQCQVGPSCHTQGTGPFGSCSLAVKLPPPLQEMGMVFTFLTFLRLLKITLFREARCAMQFLGGC